MESVAHILTKSSPFVIIMVFLFIAFLLWRIPSMAKDMGIKKFGPLELEQKNHSFNYQINKLVEEVDNIQKERMWEMTEDLIGEYADAAPMQCQAAVGYICHNIINPLRTMIFLNHIAKHLVVQNEKVLRSKISRSINKTLRNTHLSMQHVQCPDLKNMVQENQHSYDMVIDDWLQRARDICSQECTNKIRIYHKALNNTKDHYWKSIYQDCIAKNTHYIHGMGYVVPSMNDEFSTPQKIKVGHEQ